MDPLSDAIALSLGLTQPGPPTGKGNPPAPDIPRGDLISTQAAQLVGALPASAKVSLLRRRDRGNLLQLQGAMPPEAFEAHVTLKVARLCDEAEAGGQT